MKLMKRGVALALIAAWGLTSLPAQAYEKDKTYKLPFCILTIITAISGAANTVNMA
ncbi:hypothetical protein ACVXG7_16470 [Enterobacter hormaechei]